MVEIIDIQQGSDEWIELRKTCISSSDAGSVMGESPCKARIELLKEKATGVTKPITKSQEYIFAKGHESEALAREILEIEQLAEFPPIVAISEIEGIKILASLDGYNAESRRIFEHKLYSEKLAKAVLSGDIPRHHIWQMEFQLLVTGADHDVFVVSDGTAESRISTEYRTNPELRQRLVEGIKQFSADLANFTATTPVDLVPTAKPLPEVSCTVSGSLVSSNVTQCIDAAKSLAEIESRRELETDQDFADKELFNKHVKKARDVLKSKLAEVRGRFVSYSDFESSVKELDSIFQQMQSHGEKQVKAAKEAKKQAIFDRALKELNQHIDSMSDKVKPYDLHKVIRIDPDFESAAKNKKTIESIESSVFDKLAGLKIDATLEAERIAKNVEIISGDYGFLFADAESFIHLSAEEVSEIAERRISAMNQAETQKPEPETKQAKQQETVKITISFECGKHESGEIIKAVKQALQGKTHNIEIGE